MKKASVRYGATVILGLLCGAVPAVLLQGGCLDECAEYVECTASPGLRYVQCSDEYYFNDGASFSGEGETSSHCYCSRVPIECTDGTTASVCNTMPIDGNVSFERSDGTKAPLLDGLAACIGVGPCALSTEMCEYESWYLKCGSGASQRFLTPEGVIVTTEVAAVAACNVADDDGGGDSGAGVSGRCAGHVEDCLDLADCSASVACWSDALEACRSSPLCTFNDDMDSCIVDQACRWESY